jgi:hypothetical protein
MGKAQNGALVPHQNAASQSAAPDTKPSRKNFWKKYGFPMV